MSQKSYIKRNLNRNLLQRAIPICAIALLVYGVALAQTAKVVALVPETSEGVFKRGEPIRWHIPDDLLSGSTNATFSIRSGGLKAIREGSLGSAGMTTNLQVTLTEPGTVLMEIKTRDSLGKETRVLGGAVVDPWQISPSLSCPDDFDNFWKAKLDELASTPANARLSPADSGRAGVGYWKISMDNIRGMHIQGQLARKSGETKLPAMLIVQWAGVYALQKGWVLDPASAGWLVLNINAHDLPIDEPADFYQKQSDGPLKNYASIGNDNRETSYFLRMYLSCYRAAQYLTERPDWDGKTLLVTGNSQGGLQTLMLAGLHPKISAAIAGVPAGCDLTGPVAGRSPAWPMWYWATQGKDAEKVREASRYYDVLNFARHITCPILVGAGLIDETCPPAGILAVVNQAKGKKEVAFLPEAGHMDINNSHRNFNERAAAWRAALLKGEPAPAR